MNKQLTGNLAWGGGILAAALVASLTHKLGYIESDTVTRAVVGLNGLMMAWNGNRIPKSFVPSEQARRARRVAGWSLVLSGLVYAGLFAFAPLPVAVWGGTGAVLAGIVFTIGYCLSLQRKASAARLG